MRSLAMKAFRRRLGFCYVVAAFVSIAAVALALCVPPSVVAQNSVRTGGFGDPRLLLVVGAAGEPAGGSTLLGAVGAPGGAATLVYVAKGGLYALIPGGRPQRVAAIIETGAPLPGAAPPTAVVEGADGSRLLAWYDSYEDEVEAAYAPPGGPFERPQIVARVPGMGVRNITAADGGNGTTVVAWEEYAFFGPKSTVTVEAAVGSGGSKFAAPRALGQAGEVGALQASGAANGAIVVAWPSTARAGVDVAPLPRGSASFLPRLTIAVRAPAALALLPDGTALITDGSTVARLAPEGTPLPSERVPSSHIGWSSLAVASDGSTALATIGPGGDVWLATASPGAHFSAPVALGRIEARSGPFSQQLYAWPGELALDAVEGSGAASALPEPTHVFAVGAPSARGAIAVGGPAFTTPGAQPGSVSMFTMQEGEIYELQRPGSFDHKPPRVRARAGSECGSRPCAAEIDAARRVVPVYGTVDKAVVLTARAEVRTSSGWHPVAALFVRPVRASTLALPPFESFDLHVPIPGLRAGCHTRYHYHITVTLRARDNWHDTGTRTLRFTAACPPARQTAPVVRERSSR